MAGRNHQFGFLSATSPFSLASAWGFRSLQDSEDLQRTSVRKEIKNLEKDIKSLQQQYTELTREHCSYPSIRQLGVKIDTEYNRVLLWMRDEVSPDHEELRCMKQILKRIAARLQEATSQQTQRAQSSK